MSARKTINVSPDLLNGTLNKKTRKKRERKKKPKAILKPNTLKKALLRRIKEHASRERQNQNDNLKKKSVEEDNNLAFTNDFEKHLDYLTSLSKNSQNKTKKNY